MRIDSTRVGPGESLSSERASAPAATGHGPRPNTANDAVVVSPAATALTERSERDEAVFAERLAVVRAQLKSGAYKVDLDRLAQRIAEEELARGR